MVVVGPGKIEWWRETNYSENRDCQRCTDVTCGLLLHLGCCYCFKCRWNWKTLTHVCDSGGTISVSSFNNRSGSDRLCLDSMMIWRKRKQIVNSFLFFLIFWWYVTYLFALPLVWGRVYQISLSVIFWKERKRRDFVRSFIVS